MTDRLKPCPFCGGEAKVSDVFGRAGVICKDCLAEMRGYLNMTEEEVIEAWNTRKPMDRIVEQLEKQSITWKPSSKEWWKPSSTTISLKKAIEIVKAVQE